MRLRESKEAEKVDYVDDSTTPPPKRHFVAKALIGMALSVILFVVFVLVGLEQSCGGFNEGSGRPIPGFTVFLIFASAASFVGCFVWLVVEMVRSYYSGTEE